MKTILVVEDDEMNGIELYDKLHALDGLQEVPALILSADLETHDQELTERHLVGLSKPFEVDAFVLLLETLLT